VVVSIVIVSFFKYPIGATCDHPENSWHWLTIVTVDTI
jgi:hypothetical protein